MPSPHSNPKKNSKYGRPENPSPEYIFVQTGYVFTRTTVKTLRFLTIGQTLADLFGSQAVTTRILSPEAFETATRVPAGVLRHISICVEPVFHGK